MQSVKLSKESEDFRSQLGSITSIAHLYLSQKDSSAALPYLNEMYALAFKVNDAVSMANSSQTIAIIYKSEGKFKETLEAFENFVNARDQVLNDENTNAISRLEIQTEFDKQKIKDDLENEKYSIRTKAF